VTSTNMAVFGDVAPCSLVDTGHVSWELTASVITLTTEAVTSSETSVNIYQTTWCYIPEDSHLHAVAC
jgi:hypothetical protein